MKNTYSYGQTPKEVIAKACQDQCTNGYPMTIRAKDEWEAITDAVNQGIDGFLEALTNRSSFDASTGKCLVHPEELPVLLRRFAESDNEVAWSLRTDILATLEIEEI